MKKGYWAIALGILVLLLSLVTACGGGKASTTTPGATTPTGTATTNVPGGTVTPTNTGTTPPTTATQTTTIPPTTPPTTTTGGNSLTDIIGKGAAITSMYYEMVTEIPGQGTTTTKVWMKDYRKFKMEMAAEGASYIIIMNQDAGVMYMYYPDQNMAMQMSYEGTDTQGAVQDPESLLQYNPDITGTDTIDGKPCIVISYSQPGVGSFTEWVWTEYGFPLKIESTVNGETSTVLFQNINFNSISDSEFQLPSGVIVQTIS
jgi:hypothetical protein